MDHVAAPERTPTRAAEPPAPVAQGLAAPSYALTPDVRGFMESRLGHDFGGVRVHTSQAPRALGAQAFTYGQHVVMAPGPGPGSLGVLAHELAHVVQQRGPATAGPGEGAEADAEHAAVDALATGRADVRLRTGPAVQLRCGPALGPPMPACTPDSSAPMGEIFQFEVGCDDLLPSEAGHPERFVAGLAPGTTLRVHGLASVDGPPTFNEELSCHRANRMASILGGVPGAVPVTAILHHGPVPGPVASTRVALVETVAPTPTPPPEPEPGPFTACPPGTVLGSDTANCGAGDDFAFHDFPTLTTIRAQLLTAAQRGRSDADLLDEFANNLAVGLVTLAGTPGSDAIANFTSGSGTTMTHDETSTLGAAALVASTFTDRVALVQAHLEAQLSTQVATTGRIDCPALSLPPGLVTPISFRFHGALALNAVIGGTQGLTISIDSMTADPTARTYSIDLRFELCDDFGVDEDDIYAASLTAFWLLQHERSGFVPFQNVLDLPVAISGTF